MGLGFAILQLVVMDLSRHLAWDEAVYYSEVHPIGDPLGFNAHRSRGITWLVAPVLLVTDSIVAMRLYLVALSSVGLVVAFAVWRRTISWGAVAAAVLFGTSWLSFTYGSELMPNLFSALAGLTAMGLAIAYQAKPSSWLSIGVFVASGLTTLIRPLDGAVLLLALGISMFILRSTRLSRPFGPALLGALAIGIVPWAIESWARFGGPIERLEQTRRLVGGGLTNNLGTYAQMLGAPLTPGTVAAADWQVAMWLGLLVALSVLGTVAGASMSKRVGLIALVTAFLMTAPYLFYSEAAAPRFMTPAVGFLSISAGIGVYAISRSNSGRSLAVVVGSLIVATLMTFQVGIGTQWSEFQTESRLVSVTLADTLAAAAGQRPCSFLSTFGYPQMEIRSGCHGGRLTSDAAANLSLLSEELAAGNEVFALVASNDPTEFLDASWHCSKVSSVSDSRWHLCDFARDS